MRKRINKKFKALGFIEVLIAIVVVGIVSAVFLSIAGKAMKDLVQTERMEYMARLAKDGVNIAQEIANQEKASIEDENLFPDASGDENNCFIPWIDESGGDTEYKFVTEPATSTFKFYQGPFDLNTRRTIADELKSLGYVWDEHYFLLMCVLGVDDNSRWANVRFWVGDVKVAGQKTSESDVKDFTYYSVIEL